MTQLLIPPYINQYVWGTVAEILSGDPDWTPLSDLAPPFLNLQTGEPYDPGVVTLSIRATGQPQQDFVYPVGITKVSTGLYSYLYDTSQLPAPPVLGPAGNSGGLVVKYQWSGTGNGQPSAVNPPPAPYFLVVPPELPISLNGGGGGGGGGGTVRTVNLQTGTSYTLALSDAAAIVVMSNAAPNVATIPPNSSVLFAVGTEIPIIQGGNGPTTIVAGAGVTLDSMAINDTIISQYGQAVLTQTAPNAWNLNGDVS